MDGALQLVGRQGGGEVKSVRATVVIGMTPRIVRSAGSSRRTRCRSTPGGPPRPRLAVLTSTRARDEGRRPQAAAVLRWLRAAPGPQARTAASRRPSADSAAWPTA